MCPQCPRHNSLWDFATSFKLFYKVLCIYCDSKETNGNCCLALTHRPQFPDEQHWNPASAFSPLIKLQ